MSEQVRLGVVGYGAQGSTYCALLRDGRVPSMAVAAIVDIDPARRALAAEAHPGVPVLETFDELLASGDVDAIVTTVPHYLHPEMGIAALRAGIHALVEKPAGVYTKQVAELNAVAASMPDLTFAIMFNMRTQPLFRHIKEVIDAGEIGSILRTNWIITNWWRPQGYYNQSAWRATWGGEGGGVLANQAPHQLDLWQWICGVPKSVYAKLAFGYRRDIAVEDEVTIVVDYGDGATGTFITATHEITGTDRLEIVGDRGKIVVTDSKVATITRLIKPERELSAQMDMSDVVKLFTGQFDTSELYTTETLEFDLAWGVQHATILENFGRAILHGEPLIAAGSEGINGVRLANAAYLSSWAGREVPIDFDENEFLVALNERIAAEGKFPTRQ